MNSSNGDKMKNRSLVLVCLTLVASACGGTKKLISVYNNSSYATTGSYSHTEPPSPDTKAVKATRDSIDGPWNFAAPATGTTRTPDGNIKDLKAKMNGVQALAQPLVNQASAMKYQSLARGAEISFEQCLTVAAKISANYKLSPFKAIYSGGASYFNFCTDENGVSETARGAKFYFNNKSSSRTQFGLVSSAVLTKMVPETGTTTAVQGRTDILLDANYRMLEITYLEFTLAETQAVYYSISTLDSAGNFFMNRYYGPYYTGSNTFETHQKYISADGMSSFQQDLNPRRSDKGTGQVLSNFFTLSAGNTWNDFFIVLSHAWFGGFYDYAGNIQAGAAKANSMLYTASVGGTEVCADGSSSTLTEWTNYPSPTATAGSCMNDW